MLLLVAVESLLFLLSQHAFDSGHDMLLLLSLFIEVFEEVKDSVLFVGRCIAEEVGNFQMPALLLPLF